MEDPKKLESTISLLEKYGNLHTAKEVISSAQRTEQRTGTKVSEKPQSRIENYLNRLNKIINPTPLEGHPNFDRQVRNLEMLKEGLYKKFIVKPEEIPENYWKNQQKITRERGQEGDLELVDFDTIKQQNTEVIIADQKASLDKWIDYFASPDSQWVPDGLKYWALRSVLTLSDYDKNKKTYLQRSKGTTKPFPDLNREALAYVLDAVMKKYTESAEHEDSEYEKLLQRENFGKLYAFAIEKITPDSKENLKKVTGIWVQYKQGSDHLPLAKSLQGHGTGWCTAGESTAELQLKGGDFYVFYSNDKDGNPTIPRVAIRMEGKKIAEIRGIAADQNIESSVVTIAEEKLKDFGAEGQTYLKRVSDMAVLTGIEHKMQQGVALSNQELRFLYELDTPIQGFGYKKDPRINELRSKRELYEDIPLIFGCERTQVARNPQEINPDTKVYSGPFRAGVVELLSKYNIDHVYTAFPEGRLRISELTIGGKDKEQLIQYLDEFKIQRSRYADNIIARPEFTTIPNQEQIKTLRLKVSDLGFNQDRPTTEQIYAKAEYLGLELCPPEVGVYQRLKDINQPDGDWYNMGMKQIAGSDVDLSVFALSRSGNELWLGYRWAFPTFTWRLNDEFMFTLPKPAGHVNPQ